VRSDIDIINETLNGQLTDLKKKMLDEMNKNSGSIVKSFEERLKRLENNDIQMQNSLNELANNKILNENKLMNIEHSLGLELKEIKKELSNHSIILENLENKINDNIISMNRDIGELIKDVNKIKFEVDSLNNFKENTVFNFKDIGDEFLKNEELFKKLKYNINMQIKDFESNLVNFEQSFKLHNDNFVNVKKDIYSQIYDANLNVNSKMQNLNEILNQRFGYFDKIVDDFQDNLLVLICFYNPN
jgi:predicted  nucleic acid-binding Zn-ribbon protein